MRSNTTKELQTLPRHIAIIMDGNGRWAKQRNLPRIAGHKVGAESVREIVKLCAEKRIEVLTLFAFSTENWQRPQSEVKGLMTLFAQMLTKEIPRLHKNNIQFRVIGDILVLDKKLQVEIKKAENLTKDNTNLKLIIALNYSGRWDITEAARKLGAEIEAGSLKAKDITVEKFHSQTSLHELPEPDLFIRTSGEQRISNFMLWQLAYSELYFTEVLWPDFREQAFNNALTAYIARERRFGAVV